MHRHTTFGGEPVQAYTPPTHGVADELDVGLTDDELDAVALIEPEMLRSVLIETDTERDTLTETEMEPVGLDETEADRVWLTVADGGFDVLAESEAVAMTEGETDGEGVPLQMQYCRPDPAAPQLTKQQSAAQGDDDGETDGVTEELAAIEGDAEADAAALVESDGDASTVDEVLWLGDSEGERQTQTTFG